LKDRNKSDQVTLDNLVSTISNINSSKYSIFNDKKNESYLDLNLLNNINNNSSDILLNNKKSRPMSAKPNNSLSELTKIDKDINNNGTIYHRKRPSTAKITKESIDELRIIENDEYNYKESTKNK